MIFISAGLQDMITILLVKFKINEPKTLVVGLLGQMPSIKEPEGLSGNRYLTKHFCKYVDKKRMILIDFQ